MTVSSLTDVRPLDDAARSALFEDARTARSFTDAPVSDEQLREIWQMARWAPTAANVQPLRIAFIRTPEGKATLDRHLDEGNRPKSASAPVVAVLAVDTQFHTHLADLVPHMPQLAETLAANEEMAAGMGSFNTAIQAGYFILAVRAAGLAAGPMGGFDHAGLDSELFPDGRLKSVLVVNIGHPAEDAWFDRQPRLADEQVLSWA